MPLIVQDLNDIQCNVIGGARVDIKDGANYLDAVWTGKQKEYMQKKANEQIRAFVKHADEVSAVPSLADLKLLAS